MERLEIYFVITPNCNYRCKHCYIAAGPRRKDETISEKDFRQVIDHLPKVSLELGLSGGEVFTIKDTLYDYLDYIKFENRRRKINRQGQIETWVQTNGFWATNDTKTEKTLEELANLQVSGLVVASYDKYHKDQGADFAKLDRLVELAHKSMNIGFVGKVGIKRKEIIPIGRAKNMNLKPSELDIGNVECLGSLDYQRTIHIFNRGEVSVCVLQNILLPGNVIEEPLVDIVKRARKDPILAALNNFGIQGLERVDGISEEELDSQINKHGECGACFRMYEIKNE